MADPESTSAGDEDGPDDAETGAPASESPDEAEAVSTDELREQVEAQYDFDDFGPEQMAEMSADEWEAAFDPDTWITGQELLDRVEADLKNRVVVRDVFARVERLKDGRVVAYSDEGYAAVYPDGSVEGFGTVLRDVKPVVALCSMDEYDVPDMPEGEVLPQPTEVPEGSGELGNLMLQLVGGMQVLAGIGLLGAWIVFGLNVVAIVAGFGFLVIGVALFFTVANARLSDRFRAEEYRNRLRAIGIEDGERPDFLPVEDGEWRDEAGGASGESTAEIGGATAADERDEEARGSGPVS
ncbi:DUF7319 domain-containing protein [Halorientalis regularis]|jgi:hypothetical protein|uniref:DUF7319 domain-containing protein n=1 Tax=Halorientalis regularis TaxID=660518 RepID=A0A1G7Q7C6_9EURY|nr:hypothetical protein [Halorientalis regularis]SDF94375.1 hypothetical protein SAMN05216218_11218 [Halorientalis regularis]